MGGVFAFSDGLFEIHSGYLGDRIGDHSVLSRIVLWWSGFIALTGCLELLIFAGHKILVQRGRGRSVA
jgi:hypothetical protein